MSYSYFGNTSAKEANLLLNIETHLILLDKLFKTASTQDEWVSGSSLQLRYAQILQDSKLLNSREMTLIAKNARTKVSFLKDLGLVNFTNLTITKKGKELIDLLNNEKFKETNEFLQIDLVSLFFLKYFFSYKKSSDESDMFFKYLYIFKKLDAKLSIEQFKLLPLLSNYEKIDDFVEILKSDDTNLVNLFASLVKNNTRDEARRTKFLEGFRVRDFSDLSVFASSKGESFVPPIMQTLSIFLKIRDKSYAKEEVANIFKKNINGSKNHFRDLYLPTMLGSTKLSITKKNSIQMYLKLLRIVRRESDDKFANYFFDLIYISRYFNNLNDYYQQNRYYLDLTGIFTFSAESVSLSEIFKVVLKSSTYADILRQISVCDINKSSLNHLFEEDEIKSIFKEHGVESSYDLNQLQYKENKLKLEKLLKERFTKESIIKNIIPFFKTREDEHIQKEVTIKATVPTIFEYVVAIAWYYIDNKNIDFILKAGLSLDANMLPKSHAVGGSSDFKIDYDDHALMIEVTLTDSTNQRRAEMESVSRHLGNILLSLEEEKRKKSYGIFIAPHLDKNVLNDFRTRQVSFWEGNTSFVKGMDILALDTDDLISVLKSNKTYQELKTDFYKLLANDNDWGSKWYYDDVKPFIQGL